MGIRVTIWCNQVVYDDLASKLNRAVESGDADSALSAHTAINALEDIYPSLERASADSKWIGKLQRLLRKAKRR